jgi:NAD(P)-dependent dehydrogenase (short-subunit alcohol dehydrogenase family)
MQTALGPCPQAVEDDVGYPLRQLAVVALHRVASNHQSLHLRDTDVGPGGACLLGGTQHPTQNGQEGFFDFTEIDVKSCERVGEAPVGAPFQHHPAQEGEIVTVSSTGHRYPGPIRFDDLQWEHRYSRMGAYGQSKLANLLFTYELQRRLTGTHTIATAAHPGASTTELVRNTPPWIRLVTGAFELTSQSAAMGALPTLRAATDLGVLGGQYFGPGGFAEMRGYPKVVSSNERSHDVDTQKRLWAVSERLTGVVYPVD